MKVIFLLTNLLITNIVFSSDYCSETDFDTLYKKSVHVFEIAILDAELKDDTTRHPNAKKVHANFEVLSVLKGDSTGFGKLEYDSEFIPDPGYSLIMFKTGSKYRVYSNTVGVIKLKPCVNGVSLKDPNHTLKNDAKDSAS
jgi:hypothetical protein